MSDKQNTSNTTDTSKTSSTSDIVVLPLLIVFNESHYDLFMDILSANKETQSNLEAQFNPCVISLKKYRELCCNNNPGDNKNPYSFCILKYYNYLSTNYFGRNMLYFYRISSTQTMLRNYFRGVNHDLTILSEIQDGGQGRGTNTWVSLKGCLMFSHKVMIDLDFNVVFLQYIVSVALIQAILSLQSCGSLDIGIKWPNDIYANKTTKICGVLCQSSYINSKYEVIIGIGLNVYNSTPTTCVQDLVHQIDKDIVICQEELLAMYFKCFEILFDSIKLNGYADFLRIYTKHWIHSNQKVIINDDTNRNIDAYIQGITDEGNLYCMDKDGNNYELYPDANSLDIMSGTISRKF